ncbi:hypothetical protein A2W24_03445 [Microgenomates group bacterium RBG_16_45_19]|nr:MAG: hypothetical protein A2W24_03445 [Microgenomates group bacterium RBG_16_45_19]
MGAYWQVHAQYRLGAVLWIVNGFVTPLILMIIWLVVNQSQPLTLSSTEIVTYYLMSIIVVRLTQTWLAEDLINLIKDGRLSFFLIRPFSVVHDLLAKDQALRLVRLISLLPFVLIFLSLFSSAFQLILTPTRLGLFFSALILGYCLNFCLQMIVGISTFWLEDAYGTFMLLILITDILSGLLIPLRLMPAWLANLSLLLPFYALVGFPVDLLTGTIDPRLILPYLFVTVFWLIVMFVGVKLIYSQALKKYTAVGI